MRTLAGTLVLWLTAAASAVCQQTPATSQAPPSAAVQTGAPAAQTATKPPATRAEEIEQERQARLATLEPDIPPAPDRLLVWGRDNRVFERFMSGYQGFRLQAGHMITNSGLAFGAGFFRQDLRKNTVSAGASAEVSTRAFQRYEGEAAMPYLANNRLLISARGLHLNYPVVDFYGIGPNTNEDARTNYRLKDTSGDGVLGVRPVNGLLMGVSGGYAQFSTSAGADHNYPSTTEVYTPAELPGLSQTDDFARYGAFAQYDWRDRPENSTTGGKYLFQYTRYDNVSHHPFDFNRYEADIEQYFSIFNHRRIFALHGNATLSDPAGNDVVPFYLQPTIGGAYTLRGFRSFRFTDNDALVLNGEYRWEAFSGLDMALFVDAGKVFDHNSQLNVHDLEYDGGFGFRFNARDRVFLRLDVGISDEGWQIWFRFGDIFGARRLGTSAAQPID